MQSHVHNCILVTYDCTNLNSIMFYLYIFLVCSGLVGSGPKEIAYISPGIELCAKCLPRDIHSGWQ